MNTGTKSPLRWVPSAYFAMGLPFVILNMVCVLMFKGLGIADSQIALWTSIIMFPWTLKFLWSPLLELLPSKRMIVVATQIISGAGFACVAMALHLPSFFAICIGLLAVVAFSGATHDIALDGLYMAELSEQDQAKYIGWQGAFYNIAKLVATGLLVYLAGVLIDSREAMGATSGEAALYAWTIIMGAASALLVLLGIYHRFSLPAGLKKDTTEKKSAGEELKAVIGDFFTKKHIWLYIAFIILYRLGEGFVMKIVPLFLKADVAAGGLGLSEQQIGLYYGTFGAGAFNPPPKVKSAVIRLVRNQRTELGCDEALFKTVVKTGFNQRRKTLRNSLKPMIRAKADREGWSEEQLAEFVADPVFELRPERLSVEDFIALTLKLA